MPSMHIDSASSTRNGKTYTRHLLRETYRKNGKVCHRTLLNLKNCSEEEIAAMKLALKHKGKLSSLTEASFGLEMRQGLSIGALLMLTHLAKSIGLTRALGNTQAGKLALFQVFARVIDQGSRLSAVRLCKSHDVAGALGLSAFNEEDLYRNLDWLAAQQDKIEDALYHSLPGRESANQNELFLYDVSSSYLEGKANELAAFGYNRDQKQGKRQIVLGLLCNRTGTPVSIQVFNGNTHDGKTFKDQADKVASRFGGGSVTLVGDGGMIKGPQIEELKESGFHYITSIGKKQIRSLIAGGILQLSLFDNELCEVVDTETKVRYILRRNPQRMEEIREVRESKLASLAAWVDTYNQYLEEHPKAKAETYLAKLAAKIEKLKLTSFVSGKIQEGRISLEVDQEAQSLCAQLDGCYAIKTDLKVEAASKEDIHARYKALSKVEYAFRTFKTGHLELRPVYVRKEQRTRGHALVVMLAYRLVQELEQYWQNMDLTVAEGIRMLSQYCSTELWVGDKSQGYQLITPNAEIAALLKAAGVSMPKRWPVKNTGNTKETGRVSTKTTLIKSRKKT